MNGKTDMSNENLKGYVKVESERLAKLETKVDGVEDDVHAIKSDISDIKQDSTESKIALTRIASTLETLNDLKPRVTSLERFQYRVLGFLCALMTLVTLFGPSIRAFLLG